MASSRSVLMRSTIAPPARTMTRYTSEMTRRRRRSDTPALYPYTSARLGAELPTPEVDFPRIDDVVTCREMHPLVVRNGGIDVCRQDAHAVAHRDGGFRAEGDVLVRAEPHGVTDDRRVAVVHSKRLESAVGDGPTF